MTRHLFFALLLSLPVVTLQAVAADRIFKWTDESGVTHFSSRPPMDRPNIEIISSGEEPEDEQAVEPSEEPDDLAVEPKPLTSADSVHPKEDSSSEAQEPSAPEQKPSASEEEFSVPEEKLSGGQEETPEEQEQPISELLDTSPDISEESLETIPMEKNEELTTSPEPVVAE